MIFKVFLRKYLYSYFCDEKYIRIMEQERGPGIMMKKKYAARVTAACMAMILAAGLLAGCTGKGEKESGGGEKTAKGRYVEEDAGLSLGEEEEILNLARGKDGSTLVFTHTAGKDIARYEQKDGKWEKTSLTWIDELYKGTEVYPEEIAEAGDGTQLFKGRELTETMDMTTCLARSTDGKTGEKLEPDFMKQKDDYGFPVITNIQIDGEGNYWLTDFYHSKAVVLSKDTLKVVEEINTVQCWSNGQRVLFAGENGDMAVNTEEGIFTIYGSGCKEKGKIKTDSKEGGLLCGGEEWYLVSDAGITRYKTGHELSEVLMDGSMGMMGTSLNRAAGCAKGTDRDFYVLYAQEEAGTTSLMHYIYDENISAVPEHTLRVFGLSENQTVQNAAVGFQKTHPDVKVEYQTPGNEENISADDIRTLNTELLGGNGADLLLLDGLPVDSYIEKGVLADMTELAGKIMEEEDCLENVLKNTAAKDGKIYGMPVKFSVPIIYGDAGKRDALGSLDSLSEYLKTHPEDAVFGMADKEYIKNFLFQIYQEEIIAEDGNVDQEKLAALLEIEKKLMVNAKASVFEEMNEGGVGINTTGSIFQQGVFNNGGQGVILNHPKSVGTDEIRSLMGMMLPYSIMRELNFEPDTLRDYYVPHGIIGINQSTKVQEIAEEFVTYLFSDEVQEAKLDDGFSVLTSVLSGLPKEADSEYAKSFMGGSSWNIEGEESLEIRTAYPKKEEVQALVEKCGTLKNPVAQDYVVWNIYQTEAEGCLAGDTDAETAAKNIAQKVDTYRAE